MEQKVFMTTSEKIDESKKKAKELDEKNLKTVENRVELEKNENKKNKKEKIWNKNIYYLIQKN